MGETSVHNYVIDELAGELGPTALAVYVVMCRHADPHRRCTVSIERMADAFGVTRVRIIDALDRLERAGLISRIAGCARMMKSPTPYVLVDVDRLMRHSNR